MKVGWMMDGGLGSNKLINFTHVQQFHIFLFGEVCVLKQWICFAHLNNNKQSRSRTRLERREKREEREKRDERDERDERDDPFPGVELQRKEYYKCSGADMFRVILNTPITI